MADVPDPFQEAVKHFNLIGGVKSTRLPLEPESVFQQLSQVAREMCSSALLPCGPFEQSSSASS